MFVVSPGHAAVPALPACVSCTSISTPRPNSFQALKSGFKCVCRAFCWALLDPRPWECWAGRGQSMSESCRVRDRDFQSLQRSTGTFCVCSFVQSARGNFYIIIFLYFFFPSGKTMAETLPAMTAIPAMTTIPAGVRRLNSRIVARNKSLAELHKGFSWCGHGSFEQSQFCPSGGQSLILWISLGSAFAGGFSCSHTQQGNLFLQS